MAEKNKQPEANLILRFAESEHLLQALELLPEDSKKSVTHQGLIRQLTNIKGYWLKLERNRKAKQTMVLQRKLKRR